MPRRKKRQLDKEKTYANYGKRMEALEDTFGVFENAYMSTFEVYSSVENIDEGGMMDCFAGVLLRLVRSRNVNCHGVTSERKKNGLYVCARLLHGEPREEAKIVYIGKYSYFSGNERSVYSPIAADNVYLACDDEEQRQQ